MFDDVKHLFGTNIQKVGNKDVGNKPFTSNH